jgi:Zn-dependent protease with chaperone function
MNETPREEAPRRARLNPFAFPSDTTFRFVLLLVAVLGTTLYVWNWIYAAVGDHAAKAAAHAAACIAPSGNPDQNLDSYTAASSAFTACVQDTYREQTWWMLGGGGLVVVAAVVITLFQPWWIARRRRLRPLSQGDAPAVVDELRALSEEAGLHEAPELRWNPLDPSPTGLAYGHAGRYTVALTGGLVVRQATDPAAFRAVVRHELAHIRNRDVDITYFTVSLWYAFLLTTIAPFVLTLLDENRVTLRGVTWRVAALAALVYLTRNAVLRSREIYADVRASVPDGRDGALRRLLLALPRARGGRLKNAIVTVHPDPAARAAAIDDTRPLFRLDVVTAFGAGVAATIAYESAVDLVSSFVADSLDMRFIAALAFAPAAIGVVGIAVWRASFGALADGRRAPSAWPLGLALAAGFALGPELALKRIVNTGDDGLLNAALHGNGIPWLTGLVVALVLLLAWIATCSTAWLEALAGRRSPLAVPVLIACGGAVLTIVMGVFYLSRDAKQSIGFSKTLAAQQHDAVSQVAYAGPEWLWQLVMNPQLQWTLLRWQILPAVILVWAFPFAAALVRRQSAPDTRWAFLDPGGRLRLPPFVHDFWRPLLIGLAGGGVFLLAELVLRVGIHYGVSAETRGRDELVLAFFAWQIVFALVAQLATGAVAAALSRSVLRIVDAIAAAFVTGSIAVFGLVAGPSAGGCVDPISINPGPCAWAVDSSFTWLVYRQVIAEGAVAALAGGLIAVGVLALAHRRRQADELSPAGVSL